MTHDESSEKKFHCEVCGREIAREEYEDYEGARGLLEAADTDFKIMKKPKDVFLLDIDNHAKTVAHYKF